MTAFSAKVDEHGQWFGTPLPGLLSDVFGLKTNAFYSVAQPLTFELDGKTVNGGIDYYEVVQPATATVLARFTNTSDQTPAVTIHKFGKGSAIYLATESRVSVMGPVLEYASKLAKVTPGPVTPEDVYARVVDGRTFYVNTSGEEKTIPIAGRKTGLISGRTYDRELVLAPLDAELIP
jgi:beta-galactosidase